MIIRSILVTAVFLLSSTNAVNAEDVSSIARGGQLYDKWFAVIGAKKPADTHPAWPSSNTKKEGNCDSASIYIDPSAETFRRADANGQLTMNLRIDANRSTEVSVAPIQLTHWMPDTTALTSPVSATVVQEIRWGNELTIEVGESSYSWSLKGSNKAISSAYQSCTENPG